MALKFLFTVLILTRAGALLCQNYPIIFDHNSGLPSNSVYDCVQESNGQMWITTDNGISRFDGYEFENYSFEQGLPTLLSWRLKADSQDRIWLENNVTPFTYIKDDSVHRIGDHFSNFYIRDIIENEKGNIFITSRYQKTYEITTKNEIIIHDSTLNITYKRGQYWSKLTTGPSLCFGKYYVQLAHRRKSCWRISIYDKVKDTEVMFLSESKSYIPLDIRYYSSTEIVISHSEGYLTVVNLETLEERQLFEDMPGVFGKPIDVYFDQVGNQWIPDLNKGLIFMKHLPEQISYRHFHPFPNNDRIQSVFKYSDTLFLFSTYEGNTIESDLTGKCDSLNKYGFQFGNSFSFRLKQYKITQINRNIFFELVDSTQASSEFNLNANDFALESGLSPKKSGHLNFINQPPKSPSKVTANHLGILKCHSQFKNTIFLGTTVGTYSFCVVNDTLQINRLTDYKSFAVVGDENYLFCGTSDGLYRHSLSDLSMDTLLSNLHVESLHKVDSIIVVKSISGELLTFDISTGAITGPNNNFLNIKICEIIDRDLWAVTKNGMIVFKNCDLNEPIYLNNRFIPSDGNFVSIQNIGEEVVLFAEKGLYKFSKNIINEKIPPSSSFFGIKEMEVDNKKMKDTENVIIDNSNSRLLIKLYATVFPSSLDLEFHYKINNGAWSITPYPEIDIASVPYGEYDIHIKAMLLDDTQYGETKTIRISNPAPYYITWWFNSLIALTFSSLVIASIILVHKRRLRIAKIKYKLSENNQKMLMMQMKPHFLSNMFNNLQGVLLSGEIKQSVGYIKNMDGYLRRVLTHSSKHFVSLEEDILQTEQYIKIEERRIRKKLVFIRPEGWEEYKTKVHLPVFLIQPLVENAIWHGIQKSDVEIGVIKLEVIETEKYYELCITDNGIGYNNSPDGNKSGNSIALKNVHTRLSLIDTNKRKQYTHIENIETGCKVTIYVPKEIKNITRRGRS